MIGDHAKTYFPEPRSKALFSRAASQAANRRIDSAHRPHAISCASDIAIHLALRWGAVYLPATVHTMRRIRQCEFANLLKVFDQENTEKDQRVKAQFGHIDKWPRERFEEANAHFKGEWYEYELQPPDLTHIRLHFNCDFAIPREGMMLRDALNQQEFKKWVSEGKAEKFPRDTHLWLASSYYNNGGPEYKDMIAHDGRFILLDGIHRTLAWAHSRLPSVLVFMAGSPKENITVSRELD